MNVRISRGSITFHARCIKIVSSWSDLAGSTILPESAVRTIVVNQVRAYQPSLVVCIIHGRCHRRIGAYISRTCIVGLGMFGINVSPKLKIFVHLGGEAGTDIVTAHL